jgi:hypothetical protein
MMNAALTETRTILPAPDAVAAPTRSSALWRTKLGRAGNAALRFLDALVPGPPAPAEREEIDWPRYPWV